MCQCRSGGITLGVLPVHGVRRERGVDEGLYEGSALDQDTSCNLGRIQNLQGGM